MNWEAAGAIGEIVGAFAVLVTLVYLARQIRHGTDVSKVTVYHLASRLLRYPPVRFNVGIAKGDHK